jgi:hypothetical protein
LRGLPHNPKSRLLRNRFVDTKGFRPLGISNSAYLRPVPFMIGPGRRDPVSPLKRRLQPGLEILQ